MHRDSVEAVEVPHTGQVAFARQLVASYPFDYMGRLVEKGMVEVQLDDLCLVRTC